jgi:aminodeoxyfutalosine synthase
MNFKHIENTQLAGISEKVFNNQRIAPFEGLYLYEHGELGFLGTLANHVREEQNKNLAYFNRNIHLEPTNICILKCKFCSYYRNEGEAGSWEFSRNDIIEKLSAYAPGSITEVHIVSGIHPHWTIHDYAAVIRTVKEVNPAVHVKAYTAVELDFMIRKAHLSYADGFKLLQEAGLDSLPGGGAEIFHPEIRKQLCPEKISGERWITVHRAAHQAGIPSNATMLYGHLENYGHRIHHMDQLRQLQDETGGFNAFIPLKFRRENNGFSYLKEATVLEDLRNFALSRIFLDNFPHIKAYWPAIGRNTAVISLSFGVDDLDGTIDDTTKIYSMAGAEDKHPAMDTGSMIQLIRSAGRIPVERDSLYTILREF